MNLQVIKNVLNDFIQRSSTTIYLDDVVPVYKTQPADLASRVDRRFKELLIKYHESNPVSFNKELEDIFWVALHNEACETMRYCLQNGWSIDDVNADMMAALRSPSPFALAVMVEFPIDYNHWKEDILAQCRRWRSANPKFTLACDKIEAEANKHKTEFLWLDWYRNLDKILLNGSVEAVSAHLTYGLNKDTDKERVQQYPFYNTFLSLIKENHKNTKELITKVLEVGVNIKNTAGGALLIYAKKKKQLELSELFKEYGAPQLTHVPIMYESIMNL